MIEYSQILENSPYSLAREEKQKLLCERERDLTALHGERCGIYRNILKLYGIDHRKITACEDIPFLPVRIFKDMDLMSIPREEVFKTMTSSGTTGQAVSKIYLDKATAANQQKTLVKIVSEFLGGGRLPMLIIDSPSVLKDRKQFSARGAAILGFSIFASERVYALKDDYELDIEAVREFIRKNQGRRVFLFGFTFMIWQFFYQALKEAGISLELGNAVMIHGGGWKKLADQAVTAGQFKAGLKEVCGLSEVHDYYGMVEQTGCIYMECECGNLHASIFSDVITRRAEDFSVCDFGEKGIIQVLSAIPESYPGHSILTEDEGVILGEDTCPCGRRGKYFKVTGRMKNAEVRGCSDTYERK